MGGPRRRRSGGGGGGGGAAAFTLVELLVCLAIVGALAALLYPALAPARARGREARCVGNLRQIGQALAMYRQDYGGGEPPEARTAEELGLPSHKGPSLVRVLLPYTRSREVFRCADYSRPPGGTPVPPQLAANIPDYNCTFYIGEGDMGHGGGGGGKVKTPAIPRYSQLVARYGEEAPLLIDVYHGMRTRRPSLTRARSSSVLILQLDGAVRRRLVRDDRMEWDWRGEGEGEGDAGQRQQQ